MTPSNRGSQPKNGARQPGQSSGKLPAHVYRRRRYVLLLLSLVVIALLVLGVVGVVKGLGGSGENDSDTKDSPVVAPTSEAAPVPDQKAASGKCPEEEVDLNAEVDKKTFKEDAEPEFGMVIENNHTATCLIEVGTEEQEFLVQKDGNVVWSSQYCAADKDENAEAPTEFAPESEKTSKFKWNRVQVDKNCNRTNNEFAPGKYELVVKLGDKKSKPVPFELEKDAATKAKEKKEAEQKKAEQKKEADEKKSEDEKPEDSASPEN